MYIGELIILAVVVICLHGLYDAAICLIRRDRSSERIIQDENVNTDR